MNEDAGTFWKLLLIHGNCWNLLVIAGHCWKFLVTAVNLRQWL